MVQRRPDGSPPRRLDLLRRRVAIDQDAAVACRYVTDGHPVEAPVDATVADGLRFAEAANPPDDDVLLPRAHRRSRPGAGRCLAAASAASLSPTSRPRTSREPSAAIPVATTTAIETTWPPLPGLLHTWR